MRGVLAFVLAAWVLPAPGAGPLPVEAFFQKEKYGGAMISPSGLFIAVLTQWKDRRNVGIIDLESRNSSFASALEEADVNLGSDH